MVRLKDNKRIKPYETLRHFNSTMVRLKEAGNINRLHFVKNFNSTMVRLKAGIGKAVEVTSSKFQFHYGTIKR